MQLYHLKAKTVVLGKVDGVKDKVQQSLKKNEGRERGRKGCTNPSITNKKNPKPRIFFFQCKHCNLQNVKSTNIYIPVYPYLPGM